MSWNLLKILDLTSKRSSNIYLEANTIIILQRNDNHVEYPNLLTYIDMFLTGITYFIRSIAEKEGNHRFRAPQKNSIFQSKA